MRLSKAWIVASKDFKIFFRKKSIISSIIAYEVFVAIGLPLVLRFVISKSPGSDIVPVLINSFSFWFVIGAVILPVGIGSYSLIVEKVQKSLEPLLATPTTDVEILTGKIAAAFLPALSAIYIGGVIFILLINQIIKGSLSQYSLPNINTVIILLLLAPLACMLSVGYSVIVSSKTNDIRAAQNMGTLIVLPFGAIYVLSEITIFPLTTSNLLSMAALLLVLDVLVLYIVKTAFQREEILTKWG
jgi:ABC-2 type transport system permease protein